MTKPTARQLIDATGISRTYAHDIAAGNQDPSVPLAIVFYRKLGWRHPVIASFSDLVIDELEAAQPWQRAA